MGKWGDYWQRVCAPRLRQQREALGGRRYPERLLVEAVRQNTDKAVERSAVANFLRGIREPYISQFLAMCECLKLDPAAVLEGASRPIAAPREQSKLQVRKFKKGRLDKRGWNQTGTVTVLPPKPGETRARVQRKRSRR